MNASARSHVQAATRAVELKAWLSGDRPDNDADKALPRDQRNGPRLHWNFLRKRPTETPWETAAAQFRRLTGIPAELVTWEFANDSDDGWPSSFIDTETGRLPIDWFYLVGWIPELPNQPLRLERTETVEVWCGGCLIEEPGEILQLIFEEDFQRDVREGRAERCACDAWIVRHHGVWVDETDGDACLASEVHAPRAVE